MPLTKQNTHLTGLFIDLAFQKEEGTNRGLRMAAITHRLAHDGVHMAMRTGPLKRVLEHQRYWTKERLEGLRQQP